MITSRIAVSLAMSALTLVGCARPAVQPAAAPAAQQAAATQQAAPAAQQAAPANEAAIQPETNPPGDIPDNQAFTAYASQNGGYQIKVPEGWARTVNGADVRFVDKFGGVQVTLGSAPQAPVASATSGAQISGRAVSVNRISDVNLPAGQAVFLDYASNSEPDAVTGKQIRLENQVYLFYKDGKLATLTMWAPLGADNVDQWNLMARSFAWQ
jgi:hypothetical protein